MSLYTYSPLVSELFVVKLVYKACDIWWWGSLITDSFDWVSCWDDLQIESAGVEYIQGGVSEVCPASIWLSCNALQHRLCSFSCSFTCSFIHSVVHSVKWEPEALYLLHTLDNQQALNLWKHGCISSFYQPTVVVFFGDLVSFGTLLLETCELVSRMVHGFNLIWGACCRRRSTKVGSTIAVPNCWHLSRRKSRSALPANKVDENFWVWLLLLVGVADSGDWETKKRVVGNASH